VTYHVSPRLRDVLMFLAALEAKRYTAITWNEQADSRIIGGPGSELIPLDRGRFVTRGMRP
jgi:hypothetical protein